MCVCVYGFIEDVFLFLKKKWDCALVQYCSLGFFITHTLTKGSRLSPLVCADSACLLFMAVFQPLLSLSPSGGRSSFAQPDTGIHRLLAGKSPGRQSPEGGPRRYWLELLASASPLPSVPCGEITPFPTSPQPRSYWEEPRPSFSFEEGDEGWAGALSWMAGWWPPTLSLGCLSHSY